MSDLVLTERRDTVAWIALNRPDRLNALVPELIRQLDEAVEWASEPWVRAIVVTGAGRAFCAGRPPAFTGR